MLHAMCQAGMPLAATSDYESTQRRAGGSEGLAAVAAIPDAPAGVDVVLGRGRVRDPRVGAAGCPQTRRCERSPTSRGAPAAPARRTLGSASIEARSAVERAGVELGRTADVGIEHALHESQRVYAIGVLLGCHAVARHDHAMSAHGATMRSAASRAGPKRSSAPSKSIGLMRSTTSSAVPTCLAGRNGPPR